MFVEKQTPIVHESVGFARCLFILFQIDYNPVNPTDSI